MLRAPQAISLPDTGLFSPSSKQPVTIVIFGATGDLTRRKLVPAIYNLLRDAHLPDDVEVVCVARSNTTREALLQRFEEGIRAFSRAALEPDKWRALAQRISFVQMDYQSDEGYAALAEKLGLADPSRAEREFVYYLSTPPTSFPVIIEGLGRCGLVTPSHHGTKPHSRVVFEKPFGKDVASAVALNRLAQNYVDEDQLFRMDHYLGKETVQNILVFRFANAMFEPLWNRNFVRSVRISALETIGIEGRGAFYEETGVIRDVLQNHVLQILALFAMEPPSSFDESSIRNERAKVFSALRPLDVRDAKSVSLGQYDGYLREPGVSPDSRTPTFVSVRTALDNWRWKGVPFVLTCGKAQDRKVTEIEVQFVPVPHCLFGDAQVCANLEPNVLTIQIQPKERITLRIGAKKPGDRLDVAPVFMEFDFAGSFGENAQQEAYEKLLLDCIRGNQTLFARQDEVEAMWRYVAPLLDAAGDGDIPLTVYPFGTAGPEVGP